MLIMFYFYEPTNYVAHTYSLEFFQRLFMKITLR